MKLSQEVCPQHRAFEEKIDLLKEQIDKLIDMLEKEGGFRDRLKFLEFCHGIFIWVIRIIFGGALAITVHKWLSQ
jgi:hypothetical protein